MLSFQIKMPSPPFKKRRGLWSEDSLVAAMAAVINGELSQRQAADRYKIPRRTLRNHLKSQKTTKKLGRDPILSKGQEKDLVERIIKFSKIGMPLTPQVIRTQAYKFCEKQGIDNNFNKQTRRAGRDWLKMFLKRNENISKRKAQFMNPARAQKLNKPIVQQHFQEVKKLYDELDIPNHPERVYNVDEKGCRLTIHHQQTVLAEKGNRRVHMIAQEHAENVTITACVNASGNAIPPMIIFKGKRLKEEFKDNLPPGALVKMAPKGSMTTSLFIDFIEHLGKYKSPGKCLLIFDGASCHLDFDIVDAAEKNDIILYCLPSNTTHELQPLDKSVNKSFENYWDQEVMKFMYHNPTKKLNKTRFNPIFTKVWAKSLTPENIINGFRATGLFPFDPNVIHEDAYAPSLLTETLNLNTSAHTSTYNVDSNINLQRLNNFDTDVTDAEDDEASPSLLNSPSSVALSPQTCSFRPLPAAELPFPRRLVEYSSSSLDSNSENDENVESVADLKYYSPVPGTSGIRKPITFLDSSSSSSRSSLNIDYLDLVPQQSRGINIYDFSSESDIENNVLKQKSEKTPNKNRTQNTTDDSDDDVPLSDLTNEKSSTTFKGLIPTPNFAVVKSHPRRKALNYKGQRIVKDLFEKKKELKDDKCYTKKGNNKKKMLSKGRKYGAKKDNKKTRTTEKHKPKKTNLDDTWFCHGCKLDKKEDMRICKKCLKWYHEDCVGLTKEDNEDFFCPDCM